jgi:hypothetical protein
MVPAQVSTSRARAVAWPVVSACSLVAALAVCAALGDWAGALPAPVAFTAPALVVALAAAVSDDVRGPVLAVLWSVLSFDGFVLGRLGDLVWSPGLVLVGVPALVAVAVLARASSGVRAPWPSPHGTLVP